MYPEGCQRIYHGGGVDVTKGVVSVSVPFFLRHRRAGNDNDSLASPAVARLIKLMINFD